MSQKAARRPSMGKVTMYLPGINALLQALLATLADIDFTYESDLERIEISAMDEALKQATIEGLQQNHRERRAPYVQQIEALYLQITTAVV